MSEGPVPAYCAVVNLATCSAFLCILNSNDTNNHNLYSEKSVEKKKKSQYVQNTKGAYRAT